MADLDIEKLKTFISVAKEAGVTELRVETGKEIYCVKFGPVLSVAPSVAPAMHFPATMSPSVDVKTQEPAKNKGKQEGLIDITSPFVGTFYRSPSPGADSYVKIGDRVSKGQVLCIVEAMKIMNEIESEVSGEIVEICVDNESYVEFGQVLFKIKP